MQAPISKPFSIIETEPNQFTFFVLSGGGTVTAKMDGFTSVDAAQQGLVEMLRVVNPLYANDVGPHNVRYTLIPKQPKPEPEACQTSKPPLGIRPKYFWLEDRRLDLARAIADRLAAVLPIPTEWTDEYGELLLAFKTSY